MPYSLKNNVDLSKVVKEKLKKEFGDNFSIDSVPIYNYFGSSSFCGSSAQPYLRQEPIGWQVNVQEKYHIPWESDFKTGDPIPATIEIERWYKKIKLSLVIGMGIGLGIIVGYYLIQKFI